ncbi:unnamed protein product [Orchesella dallaii]|uniref:Uncharacterized protein n=1 Tax=Orchesella dallaii TaxID=48710 RepID=A0ABP1RNY9_9HEXA
MKLEKNNDNNSNSRSEDADWLEVTKTNKRFFHLGVEVYNFHGKETSLLQCSDGSFTVPRKNIFKKAELTSHQQVNKHIDEAHTGTPRNQLKHECPTCGGR